MQADFGRFRDAGIASGRQPMLARREMVVAPDAWSASVGADVLRAGGNAVDAAIATSAALCVAMPSQTSLGGDAFWLIADPLLATVGINASGPAPAKADASTLRGLGFAEVPSRSGLAVTVPGLVAGWVSAHERYGSIEIGTLLRPAIRAARDGRPVGPLLAAELRESEPMLQSRRDSAQSFLPHGRAPKVGEILVQSDLAATLSALSEDPRCFYRGDLARALCSAVAANGGWLVPEDLERYQPSVEEPIVHTVGSWTVEEFPPNSQGWCTFVGLAASSAARELGVEDDLHREVESAKFLVGVRDNFLADPRSMQVEPAMLIAAAAGYARHITSRRALSTSDVDSLIDGSPGPHQYGAGDTTHFAIIDRWGRAVSCIQSIFDDFGTGIVVPGSGVLLQNRGRGFSLACGHPNELVGGRRPAHTLSPAIARSGGAITAVFGTMGGHAQAQLHLQLIGSLVTRSCDPASAVDAPRWYVQRNASGFEVVVESGLDVSALVGRGHQIVQKPRYWPGFGHAQVILRNPGGVLMGASDPRSNGAATGW